MSLETRIDRLRDLMRLRGYDAVVVRNTPDLRWLTGVERVFDSETAHTAFVTLDGLWLRTDSRYYNALCERLGPCSAWKVDMDAAAHPAWVAELVQRQHARVVAVEDTLTLAFADAFERALADASTACLTPRLHGDLMQMRAVKDPDEIAAMRAAQAVTDAAFSYMCTLIRPGMSELELRVALDNYMLSHGADALAFDTIVATAPNSANPHAVPGARRVEVGDFVLMDFGAALGDYRSDMTRTVVVGEPSERQREVYNLVRRVHETCDDAVHAGVVGGDIHDLAARLIDEAGFGGCFNHGLGHGVGVEIHELPRLGHSWRGVLEAGSVVTIEPGVYLPGFGGVRLEDFGEVTETGFEPFTSSTHDLVVVEAR